MQLFSPGQNYWFLLFPLFCLFSCSHFGTIPDNTPPAKNMPGFPEWKIRCIDLSEDVSKLSTKNDELVLFVFKDIINQTTPDLIYLDSFQFDSSNSVKYFHLADSITSGTILTVVLLEIDSNNGANKLEPIVRQNIHTILHAIQSRNSRVICNLLGDDDLLGIKRFPAVDPGENSFSIEFQGTHLFDSYTYILEIE